MLKVVCGSCGYVARTTRMWLELQGTPICPCNSVPMRREYMEADGETPNVLTLVNRYVKIRESQYCGDCQRQHDVGDVMHYSSGRVNGKLVQTWGCMDCAQDIERDKPPWQPDGTRIHAGL